MTIFFDNPRLLATAVGLVLVAGLSALATIVRQEDPTITNGVAVIVAPFPGASAERVEALVTDKIEDELRELAEIETVSSVSRAGVSVVTIQLDEQIQGRQAEEAFSKARDALGDATARLPRGLPPPFFDDERFGAYSLIAGVTWEMPGEAARGILKRFGEELQDVPSRCAGDRCGSRVWCANRGDCRHVRSAGARRCRADYGAGRAGDRGARMRRSLPGCCAAPTTTC